MENEYKIGKVYNFDGFAGEIVTEEANYIFNINDIDFEIDSTINNGDIVEFIENVIKFGDEYTKVAKFIKKIEKKKTK